MEWQEAQVRPAWASGVSSRPRIGVSNCPLNSTAWSWQPAHHFDGRGPITSCMYSTALRYHWLLKEEKWWAEERHCL